MARTTWIGLALGALALATGLWVWTASSDAPNRAPVDGLSAPATVGWTDAGLGVIEADGPSDALTALGYLHGRRRGWTATLWRRTALGRLSDWFGPGLVPLDRHARRLGLARHARAAYRRLPDTTRHALRAYTRGLNAALQSTPVQQGAHFVLLDVTPDRWAPWHVLAVQRLLAWVASDPPAPPPGAPNALAAFMRQDDRLRRWLHLHGWDRSVAWAVRPDSAAPTTLFQRHVLGATAVPVVQEVRFRGTDPPRTLATMPGTLLFPTGFAPDRAWALLLRSRAAWARVPYAPTRLRQWHSRIAPAEGDERLVRVQRLNSSLPVPPVSADTARQAPDSLWALRWPGFSARTDAPSWLQWAGLNEAVPDTAGFRVFAGDGLRLNADGRWRVVGRPPVVERTAGRSLVAVGASPWVRAQFRGLQELAGQHRDVAALSASDTSVWAAARLDRLQPALSPLPDSLPLVAEARTYLQNWDHRYDRSSIGASIFEHWVRAYQRRTGQGPFAGGRPYFAEYHRRRAFRTAVDTLATRYGPDIRRWRWERVAPRRRSFPVWSADSLVAADLSALSTTRYAALDRPGQGHPSAVAGGRSLIAPTAPAPATATWEGWGRPGDTTFATRRLRFDPEAFFARPLLRSDRPRPVSYGPPPTATVRLIPPPSP